MTQAEEKQIRDEIRELKDFRDFILDHFKLKPKAEDLEQAIAELDSGDPTLLQSYFRRGGRIPEAK